jgi:superfamily II DNA or RNA helicase
MISLLVNSQYTEIATDTEEELLWLYRTLSVDIPETNPGYGSARYKSAQFSFLRDNKFPTGLLSYLLDQSQKDQLPVNLTWGASASVLSPSVDVRSYRFPPPFVPRENQLLLVEEALSAGRGVICAATAAGKTGMMAQIIRGLGVPPSLVMVGSRSLVEQTKDEISAWLGEAVGEFSSNRLILEPPVVVGLVQSMAARSQEPWFQEFLNTRKVLLADECHHVAKAATFRRNGKAITKISQGVWFEIAMACPAPNRYGVSATPLKMDDPVQNFRLVGATGPMFKNRVTSTDLIAAGFAARPYVFFGKFNTKRLSAKYVKSMATGYGPSAAYQAAVRLGIVECKERNELVADAAETLLANGLKVLVMVEQVDHGTEVEKLLRLRGLPVAYINGTQPQQKQEELLAWLREPSPRIMVSTRVLGEGVNVPNIGAVVFACAGKAFIKLIQTIGRAIRIAPGKDRCVIFIPEDQHNTYLEKHCAKMRLYLASEPGYRIASPGQKLSDFVKAVIIDKADATGV